MTSTSFIIGTGLKKCIPITRSGRDVCAASLVIEMEEVFEARMTSGRRDGMQLAEQRGLDVKLFRRRLNTKSHSAKFSG